jgi:hypothetical protein
MVYKSKSPQNADTCLRARGSTGPQFSSPEPFRPAPLMPPPDAPPIPEEFWLIHRYRKGGVR